MDFQAVIFCGEGHNLFPVAGETCPKAFLPVANKPMIEYALEWCAQARFQKVFLVCTDGLYTRVKDYVDSGAASAAAPGPEFLARKSDGPTAEALAALSGEITSDFVVLPCDFITEVLPQRLLAQHRSGEALITAFCYENTCENIDTKKVLQPNVMLHTEFNDTQTAQLLDSYRRQQVKELKKLSVRMAMLWKYANVTASTELINTNIYIFRRQALDILASGDEISPLGHSVDLLVRDFARRTWQHSEIRDTVAIQKLPKSDGVKSAYLRTNSLQMYLEANYQAMKQKARFAGKSQPPKDKTAALIGNDSLVAEGTEIGAKSSVKRTVIGNGCKIGSKCRLTGCVVLDDVVIKDDAVLENCIVGQGAIIHSKVRLSGCKIESLYEVPGNFEAKDEELKGLSGQVHDEEYADLYESLSDDSDEGSEEDTESEEEYEEEEYEGDDFFDRT